MPPNLDAITWILPGHRIQTEPLVLVSGVAEAVLELLVPPAGWPVVMVEPEPALKFCLAQAGMALEQAGAAAAEESLRLRRHLPFDQQPILMDTDEKWRHGVPTAAVVEALERIGPRERAIGAALMAGAVKASRARVIGPEMGERIGPYSVADLIPSPAAEAWTEAWFEFGSAVAWEAYPVPEPQQQQQPALRHFETDLGKRNRDTFFPLELAWVTQTIDVASEIARLTGQLRWPPVMDGVMKLSPVEFAALFDGLDWTRVQTVRGILKPTAAA